MVQLLGDDRVTSHLHQIQTRRANHISRRQEVVDLLSNVRLALHRLLQVARVEEVHLRGVRADVLHHRRANAQQVLPQLLLQEVGHEVASQQNLLRLTGCPLPHVRHQTIGVVG